jgi:hypothetical protein
MQFGENTKRRKYCIAGAGDARVTSNLARSSETAKQNLPPRGHFLEKPIGKLGSSEQVL